VPGLRSAQVPARSPVSLRAPRQAQSHATPPRYRSTPHPIIRLRTTPVSTRTLHVEREHQAGRGWVDLAARGKPDVVSGDRMARTYRLAPSARARVNGAQQPIRTAVDVLLHNDVEHGRAVWRGPSRRGWSTPQVASTPPSRAIPSKRTRLRHPERDQPHIPFIRRVVPQDSPLVGPVDGTDLITTRRPEGTPRTSGPGNRRPARPPGARTR